MTPVPKIIMKRRMTNEWRSKRNLEESGLGIPKILCLLSGKPEKTTKSRRPKFETGAP
jgi:hypothetical protein